LSWPKTNWSFNPCDYVYEKKSIKNGEIKGHLWRIGMVMIQCERLHSVAKTLIKRIKKEFLNYGTKPSKDHLLATKELLMKHVDSKKEEEIEQDTEYLIEMYGINGDA
jgi:hypothetical protein